MKHRNDDPEATGMLAHLSELRTRLIRCVVALFAIFLLLFYFSDKLYSYLALPLLNKLPEGSTLIAIGVAAPFIAPLKLTLALSFFIIVPIVLHQLWAFIAPGLYQRERKFAVPMLVLSILLFYAGILFVYFIVLPLILGFFASIAPAGVAFTPDISQYLNFVLTLFIAFGFAFQAPIAILLCIWSGITTVESLSQKRPYFVVLAFVLGMLLTPPDVISQILLAVPLWLLFEIALLIARLVTQKNK